MKSNNNSEVPHATGTLHSNSEDTGISSSKNYTSKSAQSQLVNTDVLCKANWNCIRISKHKILTYIDFPSDMNSFRTFNSLGMKLKTNSMSQVLLEDFSTLALAKTGCIIPANLNNWERQQLVILDFDTDINTILDYANSISLEPTLIFNEHNSCCLGYCFTEPITNKKEMQAIHEYLLDNFNMYSPRVVAVLPIDNARVGQAIYNSVSNTDVKGVH